MTYQSASGAGAQNMREMLEQMGALHDAAAETARGSGERRSSTSTGAVLGALAPTGFPEGASSACRSPAS